MAERLLRYREEDEFNGPEFFREIEIPQEEDITTIMRVAIVDDRMSGITPLCRALLSRGYQPKGFQVRAQYVPERSDLHKLQTAILAHQPRVAIVDKGLSFVSGKDVVKGLSNYTTTVLWTGEPPSKELSEYGADKYIMKIDIPELWKFLQEIAAIQ